MAEVVQLAKPEAKAKVTGGIAMTESAQDILRSAQMVCSVSGGAVTLIAAAPGTGKTEALMHFSRTFRKDALWHTAVKGEDDTPWGVAVQLMDKLDIGRPNNRNLRGSRERIAEAIGPEGILIVDEAQNLIRHNLRGGTEWGSFEWLRALSEEGCFSIIFSGDLALLEIQQRLPQLWRRMRRRVVIKAVSKGDVESLTSWRGLDDPRISEALYQVARRGGGLGDVDNAIGHARLLAGGQLPSAVHIVAALEDLKLQTMGGK
jgi:hypothetical protein